MVRSKKWLDQYSGQTTDELIALEGKYRTDSLVIVFEQALDQKVYSFGKKSLTEEERVVLAVEALEREVNNGGYDQFFVNSSKEYTSIIVAALNHIGCTEVALLTQQAINILGIKESITVETINQAMEDGNDERDKKLSECDDRYFEVAGDLADPLFEFIKSNREKITLNN
jgi:hypothetical protein